MRRSRLFSWLRWISPTTRQARISELRGNLMEACELYLRAGRTGDAARTLEKLGDDQKLEAAERMLRYEQALELLGQGVDEARARIEAKLIPLLEGCPVGSPAFQRRCELLRAAGRLQELGAELERAGRNSDALQAYVEGGFLDEIDQLDERQTLAWQARRKREALLDALAGARARRDRLAEWKALVELRSTQAEGSSLEPGHEQELRRIEGLLLGRRLALFSEALRTPLEILVASSLTVGRDPESAELVLTAPGISRAHVRIYVHEGRLYAQDLESRNGTELDGLRLQGYAELGEAAGLTLGGEAQLRVRRVQAPAASAAFLVQGRILDRPLLVLAGECELRDAEEFRLKHPALHGPLLRLIPDSGQLLLAPCAGGPGVSLGDRELTRPSLPYAGESLRINGIPFQLLRA